MMRADFSLCFTFLGKPANLEARSCFARSAFSAFFLAHSPGSSFGRILTSFRRFLPLPVPAAAALGCGSNSSLSFLASDTSISSAALALALPRIPSAAELRPAASAPATAAAFPEVARRIKSRTAILATFPPPMAFRNTDGLSRISLGECKPACLKCAEARIKK